MTEERNYSCDLQRKLYEGLRDSGVPSFTKTIPFRKDKEFEKFLKYVNDLSEDVKNCDLLVDA